MVELRQRGPKPRCLVIGGAGFVGRHLVLHLLEQGKYEAVVFDIRPLDQRGATSIQGDLRKPEDVSAACEGIAVVFHTATAAPAQIVQNAATERLMTAVNVDGTRHVIAACQQHRVPKLVYISSASVVWEGKDLLDVDESAPYASKRALDFYNATKVQGEKMVLAANGAQGLTTCALRPSNVFGEYDTLYLPTIVAKAREGKMQYRFGHAFHDWTYAGNIAHACVLADEALGPDGTAAGQVYFITNGTPKDFWDFTGDLLEPLGYGRPSVPLPALPIYCAAWFYQYVVTRLVKPFFTLPPSDFSASRIAVAITSRRFNLAKAKRELGYRPIVDLKEAQQRTVEHFRHLRHHPTRRELEGDRSSTVVIVLLVLAVAFVAYCMRAYVKALDGPVMRSEA